MADRLVDGAAGVWSIAAMTAPGICTQHEGRDDPAARRGKTDQSGRRARSSSRFRELLESRTLAGPPMARQPPPTRTRMPLKRTGDWSTTASSRTTRTLRDELKDEEGRDLSKAKPIPRLPRTLISSAVSKKAGDSPEGGRSPKFCPEPQRRILARDHLPVRHPDVLIGARLGLSACRSGYGDGEMYPRFGRARACTSDPADNLSRRR